MADGALSWLAFVAARLLRRRRRPPPRRAAARRALVCYRPYACADGWVTLGALEPKFWEAWCRGVGREDLIAQQFERPGARRTRGGGDLPGAHRAQWEAFARAHDCCLEPVLELDEALESELVRGREMVVEIDQPGAERPVRQLGSRSSSRARRGGHHAPGPALGEHTEEVLARPGSGGAVAELLRAGAVAGRRAPNGATFRV